MKKVITKDESVTYYSDKYQEHFHSITGALEESFKKYVEPCNIKNLKNPKILDICFGLGYNSLATISVNEKCFIIALEKDLEVLKIIQNIEVPERLKERYKIIKKASKDLSYKDKNMEIKIILGDATQTIKAINEKFDAVFLDPFSITKNPEMWTAEFFKDIRKLMKPNAILATYSCARKVRDNLREAGFEIKDGPCIGRRSPSTLALHSLSY